MCSCFDNAVQSEEAGKNKAACMHLLDFSAMFMCNQDQQSCEGEEFVITMAIGQKTRSGESLCHGDYHVNGPNTLLRMISFLHGDYHDYHGNWTENWERGRFLPW